MHEPTLDEKKAWEGVTTLLGKETLKWGKHWSYNFRNDPKRLGFVLSRYKFAAKMASAKRTLLELGCSEGIGASILAEEALDYTGVDLDHSAILTARENLPGDKYTFLCEDFMGKKVGAFQAVVSLDVVEHIYQEHEHLYFETVWNNLTEDGIAVIGTPNITAADYGSEASQEGHVNLFSQERLKSALEAFFENVFPFGINDEMVHTGFAPMAHYVICVACNKKREHA